MPFLTVGRVEVEVSELWMGKGKENKGKRMRTGYIKVECLLMEKKGGAFILLVPVGLLYFSFALDLHLYFCWVFIFLFGFYIFVWFCSAAFQDHNLC